MDVRHCTLNIFVVLCCVVAFGLDVRFFTTLAWLLLLVGAACCILRGRWHSLALYDVWFMRDMVCLFLIFVLPRFPFFSGS